MLHKKAFILPFSVLTALRALEPAHARCESSNKFDFRSLTRSFNLSPLIPLRVIEPRL